MANSIESGVTGITNTTARAFSPQITKQYAQGNFSTMQLVSVNSMRFTILGIGLFSIPVMLNAETLIQLWLTVIPPSSPNILRCLLIVSFLGVITQPFNTAIHSTGKIKAFSVLSGSLLLVMSGVIYITYALTHNIVAGFSTMILTQMIYCPISATIAKRLIPQLSLWLFAKNVLRVLLVIGISCVPAYLLHSVIALSFLNIVATTILYASLFLPLAYTFLISKEERIQLKQIIHNKIFFYKK